MSEPLIPSFIAEPGVARLPSGRTVLVGELEETWITVSIDSTVRIVVDLDEPEGWGCVSLSCAHSPWDGPLGTRPYHCAAVVRHRGGDSPLVIEHLPSADHQKDCDVCPLDEAPAFYNPELPLNLLVPLLDLIAALPTMHRGWFIDEDGTSLWRGALDQHGNAVVEQVPADDRTWSSRPFERVALIPVGLYADGHLPGTSGSV